MGNCGYFGADAGEQAKQSSGRAGWQGTQGCAPEWWGQRPPPDRRRGITTGDSGMRPGAPFDPGSIDDGQGQFGVGHPASRKRHEGALIGLVQTGRRVVRNVS